MTQVTGIGFQSCVGMLVLFQVLRQVEHLVTKAAWKLLLAVVLVVVAAQTEFGFEYSVTCLNITLENLVDCLFQNRLRSVQSRNQWEGRDIIHFIIKISDLN